MLKIISNHLELFKRVFIFMALKIKNNFKYDKYDYYFQFSIC